MWFLIGLLTVLVLYRVYERSAVRRLRAHVARLHDDLADARIDQQLVDENEQVLRNSLERALLDWKRAERKLARARTSRARWQAWAAEHERRYRNEFKRADQAEARLMRWQYRSRYGSEQPTPCAMRPEQALALVQGRDAKGLTSP
jgi:hypothetical protein